MNVARSAPGSCCFTSIPPAAVRTPIRCADVGNHNFHDDRDQISAPAGVPKKRIAADRSLDPCEQQRAFIENLLGKEPRDRTAPGQSRATCSSSSRDAYEIMVERHRSGSLIITSNRGPDEWFATFVDPVRAQSAIDRFTSNSYDLVIEGKSYRARQKPKIGHTRRAGQKGKAGRL